MDRDKMSATLKYAVGSGRRQVLLLLLPATAYL